MVEISASSDGRYKTGYYVKDGVRKYSLFEGIKKGTLVTEFNEYGEVLGQKLLNENDVLKVIDENLSGEGYTISAKESYEGIEVNAECPFCKEKSIRRELDLADISNIESVPVVPTYVCTKCKRKFYSLTDSYLEALVEGKKNLFSEDELKELAANKEKFINELQEYIIRIFASKRITRIVAKR
jgi:ribosomal protein L37AE/L43A